MSSSRAPGGALRRVRLWESGAYADHLKRLSPEDLRRRFHGVVKPDDLAAHAEKALKRPDGGVFGWFDKGVLRGATEIVLGGEGESRLAEAAFSVEEGHQGRGVGTALMARAILHARNHGARRFMVYVSRDNTRMIRLGRKFGAVFQLDSSEVEGVLTPPPASASSILLEIAQEEAGLLDWWRDSAVQGVARWGWRAFGAGPRAGAA